MFSLFSTKKALITTDIHSHLIPSIDDGADNIETSIKLIEELHFLGYKKLITTPHISDIFHNSNKSILSNFNYLKEEIVKREIEIEIEIGAEYYIDEYFKEYLLDKDTKLLSFGDKDYLLIEFSYFTEPRDIENLIYDISLKGYIPILAHPERYIYWHNNFSKYTELKNMGVLFQLNLNSISNYYNKEIKYCAEKLIKNSYIDFLGTDTHHIKHIESLKKVFSLSLYKKIFKYNNILNQSI